MDNPFKLGVPILPYLKMTDINLTGKRVLIREDFNVPVEKEKITSDKRIQAALPTLKYALEAGARVLVMSHFGRPEEGEYDNTYSLAPVAIRLSELLNKTVCLEKNWLNGVHVNPEEVILCENVRFNRGEAKNDEILSKKMAALCDIFVMDAFSTAHRVQASTYGVARFAPVACAGPLLVKELQALSQALENPAKPLVAIVGGSKVSTKLTILKTLSQKVDQLILGGGIANTFIAAAGFPVGKSLYEPDFVPEAKQVLQQIAIPLPVDVVVAKKISVSAHAEVRAIKDVAQDEIIVDIGPETAILFAKLIKSAGTIVWNGPVGIFEIDQFGAGTKAVALAIAAAQGFSMAGGGDTLAAIDKYDISQKIAYISTGGGAFLEFLAGKTLPVVNILEQRYAKTH